MQWSNAELLRVHAVAYQGRKARLCLAINSASLTKDSTTAQWDAVEISSQASNGYAKVEWLGLQFDTAYLVLGTASGGTTTWDTTVAGILPMLPEDQTLSPGQPLSIEVFTMVDDITTVA
jgi:hypothetical protein